jgi:putative transposase
VVVDTLGLIWGLMVVPADVQDRDAAKPLLASVRGRLPRLTVVWADGGYAGQLVDWVLATCGWVLQTVLRPATASGFVVLPKRWIVERTFAWLGRYRRLSKDYEADPRSSETWIYLASIHRIARLLMTD